MSKVIAGLKARWKWILGGVAVLAVLAGAFLIITAGPSAEEKERAVEARQAADEAQAEADQLAADVTECTTALAAPMQTAARLDSRLAVGLTYDEYADAVERLSVLLGQLVPLPSICDKPTVALQAVLSAHVDAHAIWMDCVNDDYCVNDDIDGEVQPLWAKAERLTARAKSSFEGLGSQVEDAESDADGKEDEAEQAEAAIA